LHKASQWSLIHYQRSGFFKAAFVFQAETTVMITAGCLDKGTAANSAEWRASSFYFRQAIAADLYPQLIISAAQWCGADLTARRKTEINSSSEKGPYAGIHTFPLLHGGYGWCFIFTA
jgi:hypothetical protein